MPGLDYVFTGRYTDFMQISGNIQYEPNVQKTSSAGRILTTALDLFAVKGYDATAVREICEAAGITKPTLYYFFGSKDGVFKALVTGAFDQFRQHIEQGLAGACPLRNKLKIIARSLFADARQRPKLWRFIHAIVWAPPSTAPSTDCSRFYESVVALIGDAMEQAVAAGELAPGPTRVRLLVLMGALGEAANVFIISGRPELTPELADALIDTIVEGWSSTQT
jgi:AcrR family transcriptional regulator